MSANNGLVIAKWGSKFGVFSWGCVDDDWKKPKTDKGVLFKGTKLECVLWASKHDDTEYGVFCK